MIQLGTIVRDIYTGFEGVAVAYTEWLYGCNMVEIQALELHEGKPVDTRGFDEQRIEPVEGKAPPIGAAPSLVWRVELGSRVRDRYTGLEGVAFARARWAHESGTICVQPLELRKGKPIDKQWFDEDRLTVLAEETPRVSEESTAKAGGPMDSPSRPQSSPTPER